MKTNLNYDNLYKLVDERAFPMLWYMFSVSVYSMFNTVCSILSVTLRQLVYCLDYTGCAWHPHKCNRICMLFQQNISTGVLSADCFRDLLFVIMLL